MPSDIRCTPQVGTVTYFGEDYEVAMGACPGNSVGEAYVNGEYVTEAWPTRWYSTRHHPDPQWIVAHDDFTSGGVFRDWENAARKVIHIYRQQLLRARNSA